MQQAALRILMPFCLGLLIGGFAPPGEAPPAAPLTPPPSTGISWEADLDTAMNNAKADGRPVMAYFTFDTCHWCHKLEADTFSDPTVIEFSRRFHWVKINRDVTPELCTMFNMSAYPTLMVIGDDKEKIYRFSGYKLPDAFMPELKEAIERYDLYRAGEEWDTPDARSQRLTEVAEYKSFKAPSENIGAGFAFVGDDLWIGQIGEVSRVDPVTGEVFDRFTIDSSVLDICTDGMSIYAMTGGWTAGEPIHVIDPADGKILRDIVTGANKTTQSHGAKGVEWIDGRLYILEGMRGAIHVIHPETGEIERSIQTRETWIAGLAFDGQHLWTGSRDRLIAIDPQSGVTVRSIAMNYPLRSVGIGPGSPGTVYVMEQPEFGYSKDHQWIRIWPREMVVYCIDVASDIQRR